MLGRVRPRLKYQLVPSEQGEVRIAIPAERAVLSLDDPDGRVAALLAMLTGESGLDQITAELGKRFPGLEADEVASAVASLDDAHLLEDASEMTRLSALEQERYASNLGFFRRYATLATGRFALQERLQSSRVLLLGVGGLGSMVLMNLAGLGVGRIDVVDHDVVELRNFVRQFIYRDTDIGRPKAFVAAEAARGINREVQIVPHKAHVGDVEALRRLLGDVDLMIMAIDPTDFALSAVNEASIESGIPFISGSWSAWGGTFFAVTPGQSGCLACAGFEPHAGPNTDVTAFLNPGIGPAATLMGGLVAMEALRFLTGIAEPVSAGRVWQADFALGTIGVVSEWTKEPECAGCGVRRPARPPIS
jgi:molybdopterin/thiamine biosynthesis adenylyltransferase